MENMGYGRGEAQYLSAPPYVLACIVMWAMAWLGDRYRIRWTKNSVARKSQETSLDKDLPLQDLAPGRPRASSDAPLIENRDASGSPTSISDVDAASGQDRVGSSQSPRASNENRTTHGTESPTRLHARFSFERPLGERRLSV